MEGLVDELRLLPHLELAESHTYATRVVSLTYRTNAEVVDLLVRRRLRADHQTRREIEE